MDDQSENIFCIDMDGRTIIFRDNYNDKKLKGYMYSCGSRDNYLRHRKDIIFVNDCDIFITLEDWNEGLKFIDEAWKETDVFAINFENMIKEYYFNHNYGSMAKPGGPMPIMAIKQGIRMRNMTSTEGGLEITWDEDGPLYHHMRHCKPSGSGKKYCVEPTSVTHSMNDFTPAPKEIINRIIKWEKIIKNL